MTTTAWRRKDSYKEAAAVEIIIGPRETQFFKNPNKLKPELVLSRKCCFGSFVFLLCCLAHFSLLFSTPLYSTVTLVYLELGDNKKRLWWFIYKPYLRWWLPKYSERATRYRY